MLAQYVWHCNKTYSMWTVSILFFFLFFYSTKKIKNFTLWLSFVIIVEPTLFVTLLQCNSVTRMKNNILLFLFSFFKQIRNNHSIFFVKQMIWKILKKNCFVVDKHACFKILYIVFVVGIHINKKVVRGTFQIKKKLARGTTRK